VLTESWQWHTDHSPTEVLDLREVPADVLLPVVVVQEGTTVLVDQHSECTVGVVVDFLIAEDAQEAAKSWLLGQGFRIVDASGMLDGATAAGAPDHGSSMPRVDEAGA
jgi:hypothetical protein